MNLREACAIATREIDRLDAEVLLAFCMGCERHNLVLCFSENIDDTLFARYMECVEKRKKGCPVSYILGSKEFYSLDFYVTPDVLIPRPDTETLVEWAVGVSAGKRVLDICCGSGCIGISVFKNAENVTLSMLDISDEALKIANKNAGCHGVTADIFRLDILTEEIPGKHDVILSNPPYIESDVIKTLDRDVRDFEPLKALDGGKDGLLFYPVIAEKAYHALNSGGYIGLEVGEKQADAVADILNERFYNIEKINDLAGKARCVCGRRK